MGRARLVSIIGPCARSFFDGGAARSLTGSVRDDATDAAGSRGAGAAALAGVGFATWGLGVGRGAAG